MHPRILSVPRLRSSVLLSCLAFVLLLPALRAQVTDPKITEWLTARSYARVYTTAANRTAGTSSTTWSGVTSPFYSDIQRVVYSNGYVYLYATGMPSYVAGNWLTPTGGQYTNWPKNRAAIHRIPRTVTIPATKQKTNGSGGVLLNGVFVWANGDAQSYDNVGNATTATTATIAMTGDGIWNRLAGVAEDFNFDPAKGHHPTNGAYHNHINPIGLRYQLGDHVAYNTSTKVYTEITATAPTVHSPLLGFANDGLPIYGPYGYAIATDASSGVRRMTSGFVKRDGATTNLTTGQANTNLAATGRTSLPVWAASVQGKSTTLVSTEYGPNTTATYATGPINNPCSIGLFAEDYDYLGDLGYAQGVQFDLNRQNVRWCVTPEYPAGTYAYFVCIDAAGGTAFPDIINQEYFGAAAVGQGTVTSIAETVTEYVKGGQASVLTLAATAAGGSGVVLSWPSVEGATYTAASSADGVTYTVLSSTLTGTLGGTATYTTATIAPYYKITLTALATYDTAGNGGVSGLNTSATTTYSGGLTAPTLTSISTISGAAEDTAFTLSYATLAAAADEADAQGDAISFRIESVTSGTLTKNGFAVVAGTTLLASGESLVWTPAANANGTLVAFTVKAWDGALASTTAVQVSVSTAAVNDAPVLTGFETLTGATEDTAFTLGYTALFDAANGYDTEDDAISFRVEAVISGTLTKNGASVTAGVTTIASGDNVVWTPASNANGTLAAFSLSAFDGAAYSATQPVSITVAAVNDTPTLDDVADFTGQPEDTATTLDYATIAALCNEADPDGDTLSFRVETIGAGTLTKNGAPVAVGDLLSTGESFVWTPPANAYGDFVPFTFVAYDGALASSPAVNCTFHIAAVNDAPVLTTVATLGGAAQDTPFEILQSTLATAADEADVDSGTLSFRIESVSSGTLTKDGTAIVAGVTTLSSGESLVWTPAAGVSGTLAAFTIRAYDGTLASVSAVTVNVTVAAVTMPPKIVEGPASDFVFSNESYTLAVFATGDAPLAYQWYKNDVAIEGATASTLTFTPPMWAAAGTYTVVVSNPAGSVTSAPAVLAVLDADTPNYSTFLSEFFSPAELIDPAISGDDADPDSDGLPNLLEYAFELDPRHFDGSSPVTTSIVGGYLQLTYPRLADDTELVYLVEVSSDLTTWSSGASVTTEISVVPVADSDQELVTVRDRTALTTAGRRFIRVRVTFD